MTDDGPDSGVEYGTKVDRLVDEYGLDGLGRELRDRWTDEGTERMSLRELADYFNVRLLEAAVADAETQVIGGEVENLYDLLTDDERSPGDRAEAESWLERAEVSPDTLRADFVSHQTVYNYLRNHQDAEYDRDRKTDAERLEDGKATVQRLKGRLTRVSESTVESLSNAGVVDAGDVEVFVDVRVYCDGCNRQYAIADLLDRGGCGCAEE
jgi:hypothetical protein